MLENLQKGDFRSQREGIGVKVEEIGLFPMFGEHGTIDAIDSRKMGKIHDGMAKKRCFHNNENQKNCSLTMAKF